MAKRKKEERRGVRTDHLEYVTEFLVMKEKDISKLRYVFDSIDVHHSGSVSVESVVMRMKEAEQSLTPLIEKLVAMTLGDTQLNGGMLGFGEFARSLCTFAMLGSVEMTQLLFSSIDDAGYGHIPKQGYIDLLKTLHPKGSGIAFRVIREVNIPDSMPFSLFDELNRDYPNALFPLYKFQRFLRETLLGLKYWNHKMRKFQYAKDLVVRSQAET